jgi:hypothetical protein
MIFILRVGQTNIIGLDEEGLQWSLETMPDRW